MYRLPPRYTRTGTLFPDTTLFRSDRPAEITRKRRAKLRHVRVVGRQAAEPVGGRLVFGCKQLRRGVSVAASLEAEDEGTADTEAGDDAEARQHFARQPGNPRRGWTQTQGVCRRRWLNIPCHFLFSAVIVLNVAHRAGLPRSEEHTSELQSLMRISYAVFC